MVTAFFSVFAYVWLIIILVWITPDEVELWEAVVTFAMFPILVLLAYAADCDFFLKTKKLNSHAEKENEDVELGVG